MKKQMGRPVGHSKETRSRAKRELEYFNSFHKEEEVQLPTLYRGVRAPGGVRFGVARGRT